MARYLIEREVADDNADCGVTWTSSCAIPNRRHTGCVPEGPTPEASRSGVDCKGLPGTRVIEVLVLEPYFFK